METWNAATWAKIASHAALVAAHLNEVESVLPPSAAKQISGYDASPSSRISFEEADRSATPALVGCEQNSPICNSTVANCIRPATIITVAAHERSTDSAVKVLDSCIPKARNARSVGGKQEQADDRIERLRVYDKTKKREQRDKHCALVRKVYD